MVTKKRTWGIENSFVLRVPDTGARHPVRSLLWQGVKRATFTRDLLREVGDCSR